MIESSDRQVDVAVTVIRHDRLLLATFNPAWDAYTLPMTKRGLKDAVPHGRNADFDSWSVAAARNIREWLIDEELPTPQHLLRITEYRQSDRDLLVKNYHFEVFEVSFDQTPSVRNEVNVKWLAADDFFELHRVPISPTARYLVRTLLDHGKVQR